MESFQQGAISSQVQALVCSKLAYGSFVGAVELVVAFVVGAAIAAAVVIL